MKKSILNRGLLCSSILTGALAIGAHAYAQDVEEIPDAEEEAAAASDDRIVVTGSRLRRDAFTSASPLTVLDVEANRELGITSISELLQRSTVANGTQVDLTINTNAGNSNATEEPPAGGTGSSNISLRGLGPERTLILLNGRRLASTGVRGAPSQPDINLIPFSLVERVDVVTEAGSSIYGADAVAGTVNVILRSDFEGLEFTGSYETPEAEGGREFQVGFIAGAQGDRARIMFGGEYYDRQRVSGFQRDFTAPGLREIEADENGNVFDPFGAGGVVSNGFFDNAVVMFDPLPSNEATGNPWAFPANIFAFYTPGATDMGVANWSSLNGVRDCVPPGLRDFNATSDSSLSNFTYCDFYGDNEERRRADLVGPLERFSLLTHGEVDLDWWGTDNQLYFEAFYFNRSNLSIGAIEQIFPDIPATIPLIDDSIANGLLPDGSNVIGTVDNPLNPFQGPASPIVTLESLGQVRDVELQQVRFVGGMRGDFPGGAFQDKNWTWDMYFSYDRGVGFQSQPILFEPHLLAATFQVFQRDSDGSLGCGGANPTGGINGFETPATCVPFQAFADSIFTGGAFGEGDFATQAEKDYLVGNRTNRTAIEQYVFSAFFQGDLFEFPSGGAATGGFGYEFRRDTIDSVADIVSTQGLNAAENNLQEGSTIGSRDFHEFFGEVNLPIIVDRPGVELLSIDGALRYTSETNFGDDLTWRGRLVYKPVDWLQISGGYGTSFRAPNLRESFLADQGGGISGSLDPCIAINVATAVANAPNGDMDPSVANTINNCIAAGVTFTDADMNGFPDTTVNGGAGVTTIPTTTGGNLDLEPETSRAYTATVSIDQPWTDAFDFSIAASYYDIKINNTVSEPDAETIINQCYSDLDFPNLTSPFCDLLERPASGPATSRVLSLVDITFFNIGEITARGIDINSRFVYDLPFSVSDDPITMLWTTETAYQLEQETEIFGPEDRDDNIGEIGSPALQITNTVRFEWTEWSLLFQSRRKGKGFRDTQDVFNANPFIPLSDPNPPITAAVAEVPVVWYHDLALSYNRDSLAISAGINNLLDKDPPLIHPDFGPNRLNAVSTAGYDFMGRTFFVNLRKSF